MCIRDRVRDHPLLRVELPHAEGPCNERRAAMLARPLLGAVPLEARGHVPSDESRVGGPHQRARSL
eukprot:1223740-Pyramimonas_sp.AAC.1